MPKDVIVKKKEFTIGLQIKRLILIMVKLGLP